MIDICLLGCGGMMPLPERWLTSLLFRNNGRMILIDCGEGTQIPIKMSGWGFKSIEAICFTHYHADHVAGLPGLLLTIGNSGRVEPLKILGPPGLETVIKGITVICPSLPFTIELIELSDSGITSAQLDNVLINSLPVDHAIPCLSYNFQIKRSGKFDTDKAKLNNIPVEYWKRLQKGEVIKANGNIYSPDMVLGKERKGLKVSYCTDTRPTDELADFIKDSDLLVCEGMYGEDERLEKGVEKKHMIFSEAGKLAQSGSVKEMWLTHYSPSLDKPEEFLGNAKNIFPNTFLGEDLMKKSLNFE